MLFERLIEPLENNSKILPVKAIAMPMYFWAVMWDLKKTTPVRTTKTGVKAFRVPARPLSIFSSAMQNR